MSVSTVLLAAVVFQLGRKWKKPARVTAPSAAVRDPFAVVAAVGTSLFFCCLAFNSGKAFGSRENVASVICYGDYELEGATFYGLVSTAIVLVVAVKQLSGNRLEKGRKEDVDKREDVDDTTIALSSEGSPSLLNIVLVGCSPYSVGWLHLMQLLDMSNINVRAVIEPYLLDNKQCPHPPDSFVDLVMMLDDMGVRCVQRLNQLKPFEQRTMCIIAGRTCDNPRFFRECIAMGASHIYLEVPGAPTVKQLRSMDELAMAQKVEVYMGYQRLCAPFIEDAVALSRAISQSHVFFCHNEAYPANELPQVVGHSPEGLIHSIAAQELAVLVTHYGIMAEDITSFKVNTNPLFSEQQTYQNQKTGNEKSDYSRVAFKITTKRGKSVSIMADRCGGLVSFAVVKSHTGQELRRFPSLNNEQVARVRGELSEGKDIMRQYIVESEEYLELKNRVVKHVRGADARRPVGTASIRDGINVMALADYCATEISAVLGAED